MYHDKCIQFCPVLFYVVIVFSGFVYFISINQSCAVEIISLLQRRWRDREGYLVKSHGPPFTNTV